MVSEDAAWEKHPTQVPGGQEEVEFDPGVPATILPANNILPTWPDCDSHGRSSAGSVPVDVFDAFEAAHWGGWSTSKCQ